MIEKEMCKNIYNLKENSNGDLIKIIIISPSGKEGLSLLRTKSLHIMEPHFNNSRIEQIIGRGSRFCSHKDLSKKEREIYVFLYIATSSCHNTIDEYMYKMMNIKEKLSDGFYDVLKDVAVDKMLFQ